MPILLLAAALLVSMPAVTTAQRLREVPQRFAFVQPFGLLTGIGTASLEFATGKRTSVEFSVLAVYSAVDDVQLFGAGIGAGIRRYFGSGEPAGLYAGLRIDGIGLEGRDAFVRDRGPYLGLGGQIGYRWVTSGGLIIEPVVGYEYLVGPRPLIARTRHLQNDLGLLLGVGVGWAW